MTSDMSFEEFEQQLVPGPAKPSRRGRGSRSSKSNQQQPATPKAEVRKLNITHKIKAWLLMGNTLVYLYPPARGDILDEIEIDKVAEALNAIAQQNTMVYKALDTIVSGSGIFEIAMVFGLIGARRLARHGMLPEYVDQMGGALLAMNPDDMMSLANMMGGEEIVAEPSTTDE